MNKMPKWLENAIFYEIYPQSFKDSNSDGIGDIKGMTEKLDYIKDLGCNAIWINPLFESPFQDAGYDVSNYYKVAPRYGTNDDLCNFFNEAHKRGIKVILDLIPGHTSIEHKWFKQSQKAERNEFSDRYIWTRNNFDSPKGLKFINGITERDGNATLLEIELYCYFAFRQVLYSRFSVFSAHSIYGNNPLFAKLAYINALN